MKKKIIYAGFIFVIAVALTGCYKDIILPDANTNPDAPPQPVSYGKELSPLFANQCGKSGCHVDGGHKPYLTADVSYYQIVNGGFVNTVVPKSSILYIAINGEMMEYIPSAVDRQKVYDWIRNGAPNN